MRPPETIKEATDIMNREWGVPIVQKGTGNGYFEVIKDLKFVERRDL